MKAKRLTALALAALMAASTTSVALAGERVDYDLDVVTSPTVQYYRYNSDAGMLVKVDNDDFQPGDDVYILLEENGSPLTSKKTYNAYGTWQIGDSWVKDIDLVYRKGAISTPGATTTEYYIKELTGTLAKLNGTKLTANNLDSVKAVVEASEEYKALVEEKLNTVYKKSAYDVTDDGVDTKYATEEEAAKASLKNAITKNAVTGPTQYYVYADKEYQNESDLPNIKSAGNTGYVTATNWYADLKTALEQNGWFVYNDGYKGTQELFYDTNNGTSGPASTTQNSLTALPTDGTYYVNVSSDKAADAGLTNSIYFINLSIDSANVSSATSNAIKAATNEYYNTADSNKLVTVETRQGGYFKNSDKTFLGTEEVAAGKAYGGYTQVENVYYDDNGPATETEARAAAKASVDKTLDLKVETNIEPKQVTGPASTDPHYEYWIKITTKDSTTTKDIDVVGKVSVGTSKSSAEKDQEVSVDFTLTNSDPGNGNHDEATDYVSIEPGERAVVSFADDASDEFEVEFGDDARFVFNARGQGKLNLAYNTKYNKDFAYDYDDANIDFINFEGEPTTNRTGTLYIYADEDSYIYEVTSKGAKKINGAYYDDDEEAWVIRTRNLTSYAISDKKLKTVDQMNNGSSSSSGSKPGSTSGSGSNNGKPNPDTGR